MNSTPWLLTREAADYMRMDPDTVRNLMRRGDLKAIKQDGGKTWRTRTEWCDAYLMEGAA